MLNLIKNIKNKFSEIEGHCKLHIESPDITIP